MKSLQGNHSTISPETTLHSGGAQYEPGPPRRPAQRALLPLPQARIERVPEAVAEHVDGEDGDCQKQAREGRAYMGPWPSRWHASTPRRGVSTDGWRCRTPEGAL
jgi:hypothetical protein